jgi:transcriptional regulator with GAF, ATPase, and Fis domain/Tfp pilus assembly protein PilF
VTRGRGGTETPEALLAALQAAQPGGARWQLVEDFGTSGEGRTLGVAATDGSRLVVKVLPRGDDAGELAHAAALRHPRIPMVRATGRLDDGRSFVVRDHVDGRVPERLPAHPHELRAVLQDLLEVLAFVHQRSVLHLDLKPSNLVLAPDGRVHLLDFGLAVRRGGAARGGTPFFAAPEVLFGAVPDRRADLFAVGAMTVQALAPSGRIDLRRFASTFPGVDFLSACGLAEADLPASLRRFVLGCVDRDPQRRFPDADTALEVLSGSGTGRPSLAALAPDPTSLYQGEVARARGAGERSIRIRGGSDEDRTAIALHLAATLGGVRSLQRDDAASTLVRGDDAQPLDLPLPPLTPERLAPHLAQTLDLHGEPAARAAAELLRHGTTGDAVAAALEHRVEAGEIVPAGLGWTWPAARAGRALADEATTTDDDDLAATAHAAARAGRIERAFALWRSTPADDEAAVRHALADGLLAAGEPARALPLTGDEPLLRVQALVDIGRFTLAARELAALGEPRSPRHRLVAARLAMAGNDRARARRVLGENPATAPEWLLLAALHEQDGALDAAERVLAAVAEDPEATQQPFLSASAATVAGHVARRRGDLDAARTHFTTAAHLAERLGHVRHLASCQLNLGVVAKDAGDHASAVQRFRAAKALYEHVGDDARATIAEANLGIAAFARGDAETARDTLTRAAPRLLELGDATAGRLATVLLARAHARLGERSAAEEALARAGPPDTPRLCEEVELARRELRAPADGGDDAAVSDESRSPGPSRELFRTFLSINRRLAQAERLEDAMHALLDAAVTLTGGRHGYLLVMRENGMRSEFQRGDGGPSGQALSRSLAHRAIEQQRTLTGGDVLADETLRTMQSVRNLEVRSAVCAPFQSVLGCRGALYVEHAGRANAFTETDKEALEVLADQASIAVDRMLREEQLRTQLSASERQLVVARRDTRRSGPVRLLGDSAPMQALRREIDRLCDLDVSVLVLGETGTGKELVARALHERSQRKRAPFVAENCAALPAELMERELFGHVQGAFTGADRDRPGLLELAHGGTLFLDEVGDMPAALQAKLLRALQERTIRRVGGSETIALDLRLVAATHKDLRAMVQAGEFREDLFYRLAGVELRVPPLRERGADITLLAAHFLERIARERGLRLRLGDAASGRLRNYPWPGNVRELEHVVLRAAMLCDGEVLDDIVLPAAGAGTAAATPRADEVVTMQEAERRAIVAALRHHGGDKTKAAKALGVGRTSLYDKIKRLGIDA